MARHYIGAAKPKPAKPRAEIRAAPSFYERTHPVGSAERFLDEAAKEALAAAAAGGVITPRQAAIGAVRAVAKEAGKYPDPLLAEAAKLPKDELLKRAARAEAFQKAMDVQNKAAAAAAAVDSPVGRMVTTLAAANTAIDSTAGNVRQAAKGGDSAGEDNLASPPPGVRLTVPEAGGPRIVINPTTFTNKKDALCVAFNEGFRLWMEASDFQPQSEPTAAQRKFFSDTAYADDELQLRRTILARIATFDTSVKDPTDDQLAETGAFLDAILESDWCKNDWERNCVSRLSQAVKASVGAEPVEPKAEPLEAREPEPLQAKAALGAGETEDEKKVEAADDPRQRKGYLGDRGAEYDPSMDANNEQFDRDKAVPAFMQRVSEALSVSSEPAVGVPDAASGPAKEAEPAPHAASANSADRSGKAQETASASGEGAKTADEAAKDPSTAPDMTWEKIIELTEQKADRQRKRTDAARAALAEKLSGVSSNPSGGSAADAPEGRPGDGGSGYTPPAGVAIVAVPAAKKSAAAETPVQDNGPAGAAQTAVAPAVTETAPAAAAGRQIGDIGATSFTDTKHMNGPSIQPTRRIGDIGATSFTDTKHMNGPSIQPTRRIGDIGATSFTDTKHMNGPSIEPGRPIGDIGELSFTDTGSMNGPSIEPARPIGTIDTADGSGGPTLRRKKRRRSII